MSEEDRSTKCEICGIALQGMTSWFNGEKWYCYTCWLAAGYEPDGWLYICKMCDSLFYVPDDVEKKLKKPFEKKLKTCFFCFRKGLNCSGKQKAQKQQKLVV